jgi:hypothetical protein
VSKAERVAKGFPGGQFIDINIHAGAYSNPATAQCHSRQGSGIGTISAMLESRHDEALDSRHFSTFT